MSKNQKSVSNATDYFHIPASLASISSGNGLKLVSNAIELYTVNVNKASTAVETLTLYDAVTASGATTSTDNIIGVFALTAVQTWALDVNVRKGICGIASGVTGGWDVTITYGSKGPAGG